MIRRLWPTVLLLAACAGGYVFGVYSHQKDLWPLPQLRQALVAEAVPPPVGTHDTFGRLLAYPGKVEVPCPVQTADTAVILAIGQSNAANHAATPFTTRHPAQVFNLFDGKCYVASSPLLGATGEGGEFLTPLADGLIEDGAYRTVLIVASAITDTPISRWQREGDLNEMLRDVLKTLPADVKITTIVWHQGENDLRFATPGKVYRAAFLSMTGTLREAGIDAPVFVALATRCGSSRRDGNAVAEAQRALADGTAIFLGADTDTLLNENDRKRDRCHLSESGQIKTARAYAAAIEKAKR